MQICHSASASHHDQQTLHTHTHTHTHTPSKNRPRLLSQARQKANFDAATGSETCSLRFTVVINRESSDEARLGLGLASVDEYTALVEGCHNVLDVKNIMNFTRMRVSAIVLHQ